MAYDNMAYWYVSSSDSWVHPQVVTLPINDMAILRGYSVFEALRTYNRRPFHLDEHLRRLFRSAELHRTGHSLTRITKLQWRSARQLSVNVYKHAALRMSGHRRRKRRRHHAIWPS